MGGQLQVSKCPKFDKKALLLGGMVSPYGSPYILEVGLFVGSDHGDLLSNSFMDRLGSWRLVFLSNRIMEISCQIASWIALCLGGRSFCRIE